MSIKYDEIKIHLPLKADYLGFIRLSVSGITAKLGFDIDTIEDIKVAVSEVCSRIISLNNDPGAGYDIVFQLFETGFKAVFSTENQSADELFAGESGDFAKAIIWSLMDEFEITVDTNCVITMGKNLGDCVNG